MSGLFSDPNAVREAGDPFAEEVFVAFKDWRDEEILAILGLGRRTRFAAGQSVIRAGSTEDRVLYIVISGELEAFQERSAGCEHKLTRLVPGELFGEMSFIDGQPRSASVRALAASELLEIRPEDLERFCEREPAISLRFLKEIARILSHRIRRIEESPP